MKWNRYDLFLIFLVASLAGGLIGGALSIPRILAIILSPFFIRLFIEKKCERVYFFGSFFVIWLLYALLSFLWTSNLDEAGKEMLYYPIHFLYFLEILLFSYYALNPLKSIALGWFIGFLCTAFIALWELSTDHHLKFTKQQSDLKMNLGRGMIVVHKFCSVTFGNYNSYVRYLTFAYPFLIYMYICAKNYFNKLFILVCLVLPFIFIGMNASRGGILSILILLILSLSFQSKASKKVVVSFAIIATVLSLILLYTDFFTILSYRMETTVSDRSRFSIWNSALELWNSTFFIGSGIGSMATSMELFSRSIFATHNLFLEILVQYGFFIFIPVIAYLFFILKKTLQITNIARKSIILPSLIVLPICTIIDSLYLLSPVTFAFFASIEVFVYDEYSQHCR